MLAQLEKPVNLSDAVSLSEAARQWLQRSRTGNVVHPSVLGRWSQVGIKAANGERVFLATWKSGGSRVTTKAAVDEFIAALNAGSPTADKSVRDDAAQRASEACSALERLGA